MLCARVLPGFTCLVAGLGVFHEGALIPVSEATALPVQSLLLAGKVEITIGSPNVPFSATLASPQQSPVPRRKDAIHKWGKEQIRRRADELLREKPSSFFADRAPAEIAADELFAAELAKSERERRKRQLALEALRAELPKRAERLRLEAAEREQLAKVAEREASKIASVDVEQASELYRLKVRLDAHIRVLNQGKEGGDSDEALWKHSAADPRKIRAFVREAMAALDAGNVDTLRDLVEQIDDELKKRPDPVIKPGQYGFLEVGEIQSPYDSRLG